MKQGKAISTRFFLALSAAAILSACSAAQQTAAPVVSGANTSGYGYDNGTVTTPYGTVNANTGAVSTNAGYGYNNGTVTTPYTPPIDTNNPYNTTPYTPDANAASPYVPAAATTNNTATPYTPNANTTNTTAYTPQATTQPTAYTGNTGYVPNYAPVDRNATQHRVVQGDTVYNISKRYGINQDDLRAWNGLAGNNIQVGQVLRVKPQGYQGGTNNVAPSGVQNGAGSHRVVQGDTVYNISRRYGISQEQLRQLNGLQGNDIQIGQVLRVSSNATRHTTPAATTPNYASAPQPATYTPAPVVKTTPQQPAPQPAVANNNARTNTKGGIVWQAPLVGGRLKQGFGATRGVELTGNTGQAVVAAADGQVIFSGKGPRGYDNLVIVQHSDKYLSAYGRSETLIVRDQQQVKRGQTLAILGNSGNLHFEIRENGTAVDPSSFVSF